MAILLSTAAAFLDHVAGHDHPERPARLDAVLRGIDGAGITDELVRATPRPATREGLALQIRHIVTSTGADFFSEFRPFGGLVQNKKLQLRLPIDFFCQPE